MNDTQKTLPELFRAALESTKDETDPFRQLSRGSLLAFAARIPELDAIAKELTGRVDSVDALTEDHWLIFRDDRVVGCHCGFEADADADCGYGDSVVRHLLEVGFNAGRESA